MSDKYIRSLERKVKSGDLSAVAELSEAYRRVGVKLPAASPVVVEALRLARSVLRTVSNEAGDDEYWNKGGDGYKSSLMVEAALNEMNGGSPETTADLIAQANEEPDSDSDSDSDYLTCDSCSIEDEGRNEGRIHRLPNGDVLCDWCIAEAQGAPHGRCRHCKGARADDRSCACTT